MFLQSLCVLIKFSHRQGNVSNVLKIRDMNRLRDILLIKHISQAELSRMTGIPQSDISKIIYDQKDIYLKTAKKIARALGKSVDYIWPD